MEDELVARGVVLPFQTWELEDVKGATSNAMLHAMRCKKKMTTPGAQQAEMPPAYCSQSTQLATPSSRPTFSLALLLHAAQKVKDHQIDLASACSHSQTTQIYVLQIATL